MQCRQSCVVRNPNGARGEFPGSKEPDIGENGSPCEAHRATGGLDLTLLRRRSVLALLRGMRMGRRWSPRQTAEGAQSSWVRAGAAAPQGEQKARPFALLKGGKREASILGEPSAPILFPPPGAAVLRNLSKDGAALDPS